MIEVRKAEARQSEHHQRRTTWLTFDERDPARSAITGLGALQLIQEARFAPHGGVRRTLERAEVITYVREGSIAYESSLGDSGVIFAGEFQRMTVNAESRFGHMNASPTAWAHAFQIWLRPRTDRLAPSHEQKRFSVADRRGQLRIVASPDGRDDSLRLDQDAVVCSGLLEKGLHLAYPLSPGRVVWLHVVEGSVCLIDTNLNAGDGAGIWDEPAASFTALSDAEVLVVDLPSLPDTTTALVSTPHSD